MLKWMLAVGAAALAITSPALADPKGNKGGGNEHADHTAKAQKGGGNKEKTGHTANAQHGGGGGGKAAHAEHGGKGHGGGQKQSFKMASGDQDNRGHGQAKVKFDNHGGDIRGGGKGHDAVRFDNRHDGIRTARLDNDNRFKVHGDRGIRGVDFDNDHGRFVPRWNEHGMVRGFVDGCPPGLAKKGNGCMPPGQAKKLVGTRINNNILANSLGWPYRQWYRDDARHLYRWDNDYIYRVRRNGGMIDAMFPYANRDYYYYPVGMQYPDYFNYYNVPYQYQSFYPDNGNNWYRYGDGAIYMVDPQTRTIQGIASLLTGTPMGIGQPLPPAYSVYNLPYSYRAQYYDTPNDWYRYNDGYIYRVDPATQLITAIISAII